MSSHDYDPRPAHRRVNVDPRKLSRADRVIAYVLGIRFKPTHK